MLKAKDSVVPIGCSQQELVIGTYKLERQIYLSAIDTVLNQKQKTDILIGYRCHIKPKANELKGYLGE